MAASSRTAMAWVRETAIIDYRDRQFGRDARNFFAHGSGHHGAGRVERGSGTACGTLGQPGNLGITLRQNSDAAAHP
jgi:hypothetical protein